MRCAPFLVSLLALTALPSLESIARADDPLAVDPAAAEPASSGSAPPTRWYGWQSLMADAGSIALLIAGGAVQKSGGETLALLGGCGFVFGSPLIHLAHEHPSKALGSLALRVLVPAATTFTGALTGALVGSARGSSEDHGMEPIFDALIGGMVGGVSGTVLTLILDDAVLAREPGRPPPAVEVQGSIEPRVVGVRGGATFGVGGTF
jgi:hypothetical protein